ncbi:unnamed protein product [Chondrus crispus]|uniref:Uncharacterized protein n=1 Tax=Chondrus crispus TaxID=2769 RepID=R7QKC8_CHOCR|nr:unnamed protein product [Chondrus crispus]CDF38228.1 unnamed protein product [Chondrus crispus]|eukprot:XP_005718113.1 unnamed protein product [Chondrus crispus]
MARSTPDRLSALTSSGPRKMSNKSDFNSLVRELESKSSPLNKISGFEPGKLLTLGNDAAGVKLVTPNSIISKMRKPNVLPRMRLCGLFLVWLTKANRAQSFSRARFSKCTSPPASKGSTSFFRCNFLQYGFFKAWISLRTAVQTADVEWPFNAKRDLGVSMTFGKRASMALLPAPVFARFAVCVPSYCFTMATRRLERQGVRFELNWNPRVSGASKGTNARLRVGQSDGDAVVNRSSSVAAGAHKRRRWRNL